MDHSLWKIVSTHSHLCSEDNFWEAIEVWNKSPNLINKRIFGVSLFDFGELTDIKLFNEVIEGVCCQNQNGLSNYLTNKLKETKIIHSSVEVGDTTNLGRYRLFAKIILFKRTDSNDVEITLFDRKEKLATFLQPFSTKIKYAMLYKDKVIELTTPINNSTEMDLEWYKNILLPKICKWMSNYSGAHNSSIALVPIDEYKMLYSILKKKYSVNIKKIWTEVTDPDKFIHEDIAIATYLLLIWKGKPPQKFLDLGCGNGLLVHILNGESHLGVGYDLRARKIWGKYPSSTILKVMQIKPSKEPMFEEVDWIIGNHSDELTPWIPVISTFNSPHCNFFLLPCCAYEFDGSNFRRNNSSKSCYNDYLDYVENICVKCGFNVERDKLRIPSTKRVCFVSKGRYHDINEIDNFKNEINNLIENSSSNIDRSQSDSWNIKVKLRDSEEKVRNCTQINKNLKENIVDLMSKIILQETNNLSRWDEGNPTRIEEIIQRLPPGLLKQLKNEGKGLQTFIKNHHHIFKLENGIICFRKPTPSKVKSDNWKTKPCWFYSHHPNSCPLDDEQCSYKHNL